MEKSTPLPETLPAAEDLTPLVDGLYPDDECACGLMVKDCLCDLFAGQEEARKEKDRIFFATLSKYTKL
jgi:hypothetical protein